MKEHGFYSSIHLFLNQSIDSEHCCSSTTVVRIPTATPSSPSLDHVAAPPCLARGRRSHRIHPPLLQRWHHLSLWLRIWTWRNSLRISWGPRFPLHPTTASNNSLARCVWHFLVLPFIIWFLIAIFSFIFLCIFAEHVGVGRTQSNAKPNVHTRIDSCGCHKFPPHPRMFLLGTNDLPHSLRLYLPLQI